MINCIVRRRRTRVRFRTFALVRTSTTGIGEGGLDSHYPSPTDSSAPNLPLLTGTRSRRTLEGCSPAPPFFASCARCSFGVESDIDRLRRVGRFGDEEILDRDGSTAGRLISPGCVQEVAARCQQKESWTGNAITMPHTKGRFSLPGDPKRERPPQARRILRRLPPAP